MVLIKENWELIKDTLRNEYDLSDISYNTWVKPLNFHNVQNDVVTIMIPSDQAHALKYISSKYKSYFQVTISEMFDHTYDVAFILESDIENETSEMMTAPGAVYNINYENANLNPKYTFDTFVVGNNNRFAHSASVAVAESPGTAYNPLFLYGGSGLGKTHLMHSIGHFILDQNSEKKVLYVTSEQFMNEVIESIRSGNASKMTKFREKYRTVDVLLIDDIQFIIGKESTQEEFFHTFNELHQTGKQIVLSSDKPPKEMETLEERLRTRFEWGLITDIQAPDYETRMAILKKNAETYNKSISDEIFDYIATNIKSNIRELEGAYNKVIAFTKLNNVEITLDNVKEALKDIISPEVNRQINMQLIINIVADHYNIKYDDIVSKKRDAKFVLPRQICMYLGRDLTDLSLQDIGKALGKGDHTTIRHGILKITEEMGSNEELKNTLDIILKKINPA